jgi:hypothetical protein
MRKFLLLPAMLILAGCQGVGVHSAVRLGANRYALAYRGAEGAAVNAAQYFCSSKGYSYAAITLHVADRIVFQCMREGDRMGRGLTCMQAASGAKVCGLF